jgi:hypothetical protein
MPAGRGGRQRWCGGRQWLGGAGRGGSVAREPGETRVHVGCGGEGGLSPRRLIDGEGGEERWLR